ncbi:hypothetical protein ETAA8_63600 [Anatilimnocola aggregata]|uniref:DUF1501 domain-containing protein n=1 Tax=Anatilimnocola aggregata TaxID=2528021 RepID=A0A517YLU4_9BACT|nr:DUF1501 domain-containing protein [Anatilimnocola aggregata]QDU31207.1 hypothetical protein ETAA8_63600 [Anatilimnocola aggregata]
MTKLAAQHPQFSRRTAIQAGSIGLLGLGMNHLSALQAADSAGKVRKAKSVIYIFLSGGLAQQDSFDPKPDAPENVRGEFKAINTKTPGVHVSEHLPLLAARSDKWAVVRSLTHPYNEHSQGHMVMLSGRSPMPVGFNPSKPMPGDWPSMAAITSDVLRPTNNLPPAVVLPERLIHRTGRVIPGQFAGLMGPKREPWFISASPFNGKTYGAYPEYEFHHETGKADSQLSFQAPNLALPEGLSQESFANRQHLRRLLDGQRGELEQAAGVQQFDRFRQSAISLLSEPSTQAAFDVTRAPEKLQDAYGRNSFGRSLLMARQLVEAGVSLVQVNLGNNEAWDTHQSIFPNLKNFLLPPTDKGVSALLDDLEARGLLDDTLIVMAGEFGRTPRVFGLSATRLPGRDHWGAVQSVFFAGGGVKGGTVIGSSDRIGGYPHNDPQTPEQMAATIYSSLGIPPVAHWRDESDRPHHIYHADPIPGLLS